MARITFTLDGVRTQVLADAGERLLSVARRAGIAIDAPCGGNGTCGKCLVRLIAGSVSAAPSRHLSDDEFAQGWRLACSSLVDGDATVEVPRSALAYRDRIRVADLSSPRELQIFQHTGRAIEAAGLDFGCGISAVDVALEPPTADDTRPDNERLSSALLTRTQAREARLTYPALRALARVLRENGFAARCVVEREGDALRVLDVLAPGDAAPLAGLAVDLGTTTASALLVDLSSGRVLAKASAGNAQIRYGADVISRILEADRPGGGERLQRAVVDETLTPLALELCASAGIEPERVYRVAVTGNTTMNHLLLGVYADPVRMEPYVPSFFRCDDLRAASLGLRVHPEARLILAPNVGSYVGGDITAGAFAAMLWNEDPLTLFVDLGTNGELVLGNREFTMCCACSAGPAFEGGGISCGMRATDGAIDSVTIDPETWEPRYTWIGDAPRPAGICGSGIIDLVAELFARGVIDGRGRFTRPHRRVRFDADGVGSYVLAAREETGGEKDIAVSEVDIDSFIRAKGAIFSAVMTMLDALGLERDALERVLVAGGIGSGINLENAVRVGMLPDIAPQRFRYVGNSSLAGAWAMLTSDACRRRVDALAREMTYLELSTEPGYMDAFVAACFLPHTDTRLFPRSGRA